MTSRNPQKKGPEVYSATDEARNELDAARAFAIPTVDQVTILPGDRSVPVTFAEEIYADRAAEQPHHYEAAGTVEARDAAVTAAGLKAQADAAQFVVDHTRELYDTAVATLMALLMIFASHRMRTPKAKYAYWLRTVGLWIGDVVGVGTAAILLGEIPALAVLMACSAATATVTAGLVGKELKWIRERRRRACDELTDDQKPYAHLLRGVDKGERLAFRMVTSAGFVVGMVACSICALRASVDSVTAGLTFAMLAGGVGIGSVISSYIYADEVSDVIQNAQTDVELYRTKLGAVAASPALSQYLAAIATAQSITSEYEQRGQAAVHTVGVAKNSMLAANPAVVGHGRPAPETAPVGRLRRGD